MPPVRETAGTAPNGAAWRILASAADELRAIAADVGRGAAIAADHDAKRLAACYPDPTRRHLMEMRMTREGVRRG
jgi:hypothetical protein